MRLRIAVAIALTACGDLAIDAAKDASNDAEGDTTLIDANANDVSIACPKGEIICGNACVPNDIDHCGVACVACAVPTNGKAICDGVACSISCDTLQCGSSCVAPATDSQNCGACAHNCKGTTCTDGTCQPELLYAEVPTALAVDANNVYWTEGTGHVRQGPKAGGKAITLSSAGVGVAVDAQNVYFTGNAGAPKGVFSIPIDGGAIAAFNAPTSIALPELAVDSQGTVYFSAGLFPITLYSGSFDGGAATALASTPQMTFFARSGTDLFVSDVDPNFPYYGNVTEVEIDGGLAPIVVDDGGTIQQFGVDTTSVYFGTNALRSFARDGGAVSTLAPATAITQVAVDATNIYWVDESKSGSTLYATSITASTTSTRYACSACSVSTLVFDDTYLYFGLVNNAQNGLYRIAK